MEFPDLEEIEVEPEKIFFFGTPFFVRILKGKIFVISGDMGYFLYCIRCEAELWKKYEKPEERKLVAGETEEKASRIKAISSQELIFVSDVGYDSDVGDKELKDLILSSIERMETEDKFLKDIIYSSSNDVPSPIIPKSEKEDMKIREKKLVPELREMMLIEKRCYDLLRKGKPCK